MSTYMDNEVFQNNIKCGKRIKNTGEIFTPILLCNEMILNVDTSVNTNKLVIDPACGNGQFLIAVAQQRKCLANIFGVDLMVDNVCDTIVRLHLFKLRYNDVFDHLGHTNSLVTEVGHGANEYPEFEWLLDHITTFKRTYQYKDVTLTVKPAKYIESGIIFKCNDVLYPTIVCANSLEFFKDGGQNGYDELTSEIETFNKNNSDAIVMVEDLTVVPELVELPSIDTPVKSKITKPSKPKIIKERKRYNVDIATEFYNAHPNMSRGDMIEQFIQLFGITKSNAGIYYGKANGTISRK